MKSLSIVLAALLFAALPGQLRAGDESQFIAVLESNAGAREKCEACRELLAAGTPRCIAPLARALRDERTGHAALSTLERLPFPEAPAALIQALSSIAGPIRIGIVDALGWKRAVPAVPALIPLLANPDDALAAAAANALARMGDPAAESALTNALDRLRPSLQPALAAGLLHCAEHQLRSGSPAKAAELYRRLRASPLPVPVRAAALHGLLAAEPASRPQLLGEAISGPDGPERRTALKFLHAADPAALATLASGWPALPAPVQAALLENPSRLGKDAVPRVLAAAAAPDEQLRLTALRVMGEMKEPALVSQLVKTAAEGPKSEQMAAQESLAVINGPGIQEAFASCLSQTPGTGRVELLRNLGRRGTPETAALLLPDASNPDESIRQAARQSLLILAAPASLVPLVELALGSSSESDRQQLLRITSEIARRPECAAELNRTFALLLSRLLDPQQASAARAIAIELAGAAKASHPALSAKILQSIPPP